MTDLRAAAQQALEAMLNFPSDISDEMFESIRSLKAALAEFSPDWDRIEPLQENLREHMAEIQRLRAKLATGDNLSPTEPVQEPVEPVPAKESGLDRFLALAEAAGVTNITPEFADRLTARCTQIKHAVQEPVAWVLALPDGRLDRLSVVAYDDEAEEMLQRSIAGCTLVPLYTAPPQRKPLTEEEVYSLFRVSGSPVEFARAIERAHGITP